MEGGGREERGRGEGGEGGGREGGEGGSGPVEEHRHVSHKQVHL